MSYPLKSVTFSARLSIIGTLFYAFVMYVAFAFIQPELDPLYRFGSEYSVGRMGWLMKLAFYVWSGGLIALAFAMAKGLDEDSRSTAAIILFAVGALGVFFAGVFDSDLQVLNDKPPPLWVEPPASDESNLHSWAGMIGLVSLMIGAGIASRRLRLAGKLQSAYHSLRWLSWLTPVLFIAFATYFVSIGLAGLGQRIFLALMFAWQVIVAWGLGSGAFHRVSNA